MKPQIVRTWVDARAQSPQLNRTYEVVINPEGKTPYTSKACYQLFEGAPCWISPLGLNITLKVTHWMEPLPLPGSEDPDEIALVVDVTDVLEISGSVYYDMTLEEARTVLCSIACDFPHQIGNAIELSADTIRNAIHLVMMARYNNTENNN